VAEVTKGAQVQWLYAGAADAPSRCCGHWGVTLCPRDSRGAIAAALAGDLDIQKSFTKLRHTCEIQGFLKDNYLQQGVCAEGR